MAVRRQQSGWTLMLGGLAAATVVAGGIFMSISSETVVRNSFTTALANGPGARPQFAGLPTAKPVPVAGTEDFWLTASNADGSLHVTKAISVGDHISMTLGGQDRQLEVAAVKEFAPAATEIDTRAKPSRFVLVTARDTASKDTRSIRFVMEIDQTPVPAIGAQARAL